MTERQSEFCVDCNRYTRPFYVNIPKNNQKVCSSCGETYDLKSHNRTLGDY